MKELIERLTSKPTGFASPYEAGRDAATSGPNYLNTNYAWFTSPDSTAEWQRGYDEAKR